MIESGGQMSGKEAGGLEGWGAGRLNQPVSDCGSANKCLASTFTIRPLSFYRPFALCILLSPASKTDAFHGMRLNCEF
jgi:hypothetical protein